jgi:hypothetical protein
MDIDCNDFVYEESITTQSWNSENKIINNIIKIPNQQTLTIENNSNIQFTKCAKIIVEPGATLIIDNATLTSLGDRFWDGIIVRGDRNSTQMPGVAGKLIMTNGAKIENASCGVQLADEWNYYCGVIQADNSTFKNCRKAVEFMSYPFNNTSYFSECIFECTGPLSDPMYEGAGINHFVTMWEVSGVQFAGNVFKNTSDYDVLPSGERGTAIGSVDAGYDVMKTDIPGTTFSPCDYPDGIPNKFYDLDMGVYNGDINPALTYEVRIRENEFYNCNIAFQVDNEADNFIAYKNYLKYGEDPAYYDYPVPANITLINPIGISTSESEQIKLIENEISFSAAFPINISSYWLYLPVNNLYVGMYTNTTYIGNTNYPIIYNNKQWGGVFPHVGQYITGDCRDLQITCNDYNSLDYFDWYIDPDGALNHQTLAGTDAGNNFNPSVGCGGQGIPYNSINYQPQIGINYVSYQTSLSLNCVYNVFPSALLTQNPCSFTSTLVRPKK